MRKIAKFLLCKRERERERERNRIYQRGRVKTPPSAIFGGYLAGVNPAHGDILPLSNVNCQGVFRGKMAFFS